MADASERTRTREQGQHQQPDARCLPCLNLLLVAAGKKGGECFFLSFLQQPTSAWEENQHHQVRRGNKND